MKIKDIAILKTGPFGTQLKASEYVNNGIPVINVKNIGYGNVIPKDLDYVSESTRDRLSEHILKKGDIVFGRKGSVDRHCIITENEDGWLQGSDCLRVRIVNENINSQFISYYLLCNHIIKTIHNSAVGSTMASLNMDIIGEIPIIYHSFDNQNKIAKVLSTIDGKIKNNNTLNDNLSYQSAMVA